MAKPDYQFGWHHQAIYEELQEFATGAGGRLIIEAPPGHGKSEAISRLLPAWIMGRNPDTRIIATSYAMSLATDMCRDVLGIMDSLAYQAVFPSIVLPSKATGGRRANYFEVEGSSGYYRAAGVGVGITGKRFELGLIDDPVKDRAEARSMAKRDGVWRWFTSVFNNRRARDAKIAVTATRWDDDDLIGRIKRVEGGRWRVVTLPAIADGRDGAHRLDVRAPGESLWPWFRSAAQLEQIRLLEPLDFSALYQQQPLGEGASEWPAEYFGPDIWFDDWPSMVVRVLALDPSKGKESKSGDYSAYVMLGVDSDRDLWVEADLARRPVPRMVADGVELHRRFQPHAFAVEVNQFQELLGGELARVARASGIDLPLYGITNTLPKLFRVRQLGPLLAQKRIRFRATPGTRLLVQQLREFPGGVHDDGPDSLQMAVVTLNTILSKTKSVGRGAPKVLAV